MSLFYPHGRVVTAALVAALLQRALHRTKKKNMTSIGQLTATRIENASPGLGKLSLFCLRLSQPPLLKSCHFRSVCYHTPPMPCFGERCHAFDNIGSEIPGGVCYHTPPMPCFQQNRLSNSSRVCVSSHTTHAFCKIGSESRPGGVCYLKCYTVDSVASPWDLKLE